MLLESVLRKEIEIQMIYVLLTHYKRSIDENFQFLSFALYVQNYVYLLNFK